MTAPPCATCGAPMRWYADFAGWGCDRCRQFHPVAAAPRSRTALYLGLGAGVLVLLVVTVLAATSGDDEGGGSSRRSRSRSSGMGGATYGFKGDTVDEAVEAMRDFRDRMCDCRTEACADRVDRDVKAFERAMEKKFSEREIEELMKDKRLFAKVERLEEERKKCRDKARRGDTSEMLDMYERYAARTCMCKDAACAQKISEEMAREATDWAKRHASSTPSPEAMKQIESAVKRFTDCYVKVATASAGSAAATPDP